jgi:hypothetical protein
LQFVIKDIPGLPALTPKRVDKVAVGQQLARMAVEELRFPGKRLPEVILPVTLMKRGPTRLVMRDAPVL